MSDEQPKPRPDESSPEPPQFERATRKARLVAALVDSAALFVAGWAVFAGLLVYGVPALVAGLGLWLGVLGLNVVWLHRYGQSIGKRAMGICILSREGERVPLTRLLVHRGLLGYLGTALRPWGVLLFLFDSLLIFRGSRRCLHDDIAGTEVAVGPQGILPAVAASALAAAAALVCAVYMLMTPTEAWLNEGPSMEPTLINGDRIGTLNLLGLSPEQAGHTGLLAPDTLRRGDIVVAASPADGSHIVKRVIGLAGDRVEVRSSRIVLNEQTLPTRDVGACELGVGRQNGMCRVFEITLDGRTFLTSYGRIPLDPQPVAVPPGHVYLLGDHLDSSNDSRNPAIGPVAIDHIIGIAKTRYWARDTEDNLDMGRMFQALK